MCVVCARRGGCVWCVVMGKVCVMCNRREGWM